MARGKFTAICTVTFPANQSANKPTPVNITIDPISGSKTEHQVPRGVKWKIVDIYVISSPSVDAVVEIWKNRKKKEFTTDPLSTLLVSNPSRPTQLEVEYKDGDILSMRALNLSAIGTSAVTVTFYVTIIEEDIGAGGGLLSKLKL